MPVSRVQRPWGTYLVLDERPTHRVKQLTVRPGHRLSYQRHRDRAEHWYVIAGTGLATIDDREIGLGAGDSVDVSAGTAHRVANTGTDPLVLIEIQAGRYLGEDDIERLADDYGRDRSRGAPGVPTGPAYVLPPTP